MILATHGILASSGSAFLLDNYPNAAAAYSLRKLRSAYTGNAIRVRRASDNTETDIGFSSANLDTLALTSFCGSGDGFVTTWYDQSGNGNNITQTTATQQPQIVSSGSVINVNSKPSIFSFNKIGNLADISGSSAYSVFFTIKTQQDPPIITNGGIANLSTAFNTNHYPFIDGNVYIGFGSTTRYSIGAMPSSTAVLNNFATISASNLYTAYFNKSLVYSNNSNSVGFPSNAYIGSSINLETFNGHYSELIIYPSNQNSNAILIQDNQKTYYGTP
jgi:hypothetical protein